MLLPMFLIFFVMLAMGAPIAITLGVAGTVALAIGSNFDLSIVMQRMFFSINSFPLMAIPFFMLCGAIMEQGGISKRIIRLADTLFGHLNGGLGIAGVAATIIFASISGSAVATVAAIGALVVPEMVRKGYKASLACASVASAGITGVILPPSVLFVVYAAIAGVSVTDMFMGGYIPGLMLGLSVMAVMYFRVKKLDLPKREKATSQEVFVAFKEALLALFAPVIIIVGIMGGIATPTEAGAVACVYAFIVGWVFFRELNIKLMMKALKDAAISASIILYLIATSSIFAWIMTVERVPQNVQTLFVNLTGNAYVLLFLIILLLFLVGSFIDAVPAITMVAPVLVPLARAYGIDLVHFGIIMCMTLAIGLLTPPVGSCLFVGCRLGKISVMELVAEIWPMLIALLVVLFVCVYFPGIVMFIPNLVRSF